MPYKICTQFVALLIIASPVICYPTDQYNTLHQKKPAKPYSFFYGVKDEYAGTDYERNEKSDGSTVVGSYSVQLPDGRKQIVNYEADHHKGYVADVSYHGDAQYPPPSKAAPFLVKAKPSEYDSSSHKVNSIPSAHKQHKPIISPMQNLYNKPQPQVKPIHTQNIQLYHEANSIANGYETQKPTINPYQNLHKIPQPIVNPIPKGCCAPPKHKFSQVDMSQYNEPQKHKPEILPSNYMHQSQPSFNVNPHVTEVIYQQDEPYQSSLPHEQETIIHTPIHKPELFNLYNKEPTTYEQQEHQINSHNQPQHKPILHDPSPHEQLDQFIPDGQQSYESEPHEEPSYELTPHQQQSYKPNDNEHQFNKIPQEESYEPSPHEQESYEPSLHSQQPYGSSPIGQQSYEPNPHEQLSFETIPHEPQLHDQSPTEPQQYEESFHGQLTNEPDHHGQQSYESNPHDQPSYEPGSYESQPHEPNPNEQHTFEIENSQDQHSYEPSLHEQEIDIKLHDQVFPPDIYREGPSNELTINQHNPPGLLVTNGQQFGYKHQPEHLNAQNSMQPTHEVNQHLPQQAAFDSHSGSYKSESISFNQGQVPTSISESPIIPRQNTYREEKRSEPNDFPSLQLREVENSKGRIQNEEALPSKTHSVPKYKSQKREETYESLSEDFSSSQLDINPDILDQFNEQYGSKISFLGREQDSELQSKTEIHMSDKTPQEKSLSDPLDHEAYFDDSYSGEEEEQGKLARELISEEVPTEIEEKENKTNLIYDAKQSVEESSLTAELLNDQPNEQLAAESEPEPEPEPASPISTDEMVS